MLASTSLLIALGALLVEAAFGYPAWLLRRIGHPVMWAGAAIARLDRRLNSPSEPSPFGRGEGEGEGADSETYSEAVGVTLTPPSSAIPPAAQAEPSGASALSQREREKKKSRRLRGVISVALLVALAGLPAWGVQLALLHWLPRPIAVALLAIAGSTLLAQRSLSQHVDAVAEGLDRGLAEGREAVAHIVGRDPESLDAAGVARAAIESLAENFSDGVVAPALWCALLGLPGIAIYKAVNTADSMIGHRTPRHAQFGWAAARLDDLVNLPASRLAALLLAMASGRAFRRATRAVWRDARRHRSPNAGWPEAAMAGALGLRLAGPRIYDAVRVEDGWMGDGRAEAGPADIRCGLVVFRRACWIGWTALAAAAAAVMMAP